MKFSVLLHRLRVLGQVLRKDPQAVLRAPRFLKRMLREGPDETLARLRRISDPRRFSVDYEAWRAEFGTTAAEKVSMSDWAQALVDPPIIAAQIVWPYSGGPR